MGKCPNCGVPLMGSMTECPKCHFDSKIGDIAPKYLESRRQYCMQHPEEMSPKDIERWPELFAAVSEERRAAEEERKRIAAEQEEEQKRKAAALPKILISSGFNFDGYRIVKYSGYISGDDAVQIPRGGVWGTNNGQNLTDALVKIRRKALAELKEAAYDLGCNAVIGVDFDYLTIEPETANITGGTLYEPYVICVTANGNAVIIEKEE